MPECQATRYAPGACSETPPKFEVVYFNSKGAETDSHPACFQHGLAEVDRHHASGGIARAELKERRP
jgi:hypothetical protein